MLLPVVMVVRVIVIVLHRVIGMCLVGVPCIRRREGFPLQGSTCREQSRLVLLGAVGDAVVHVSLRLDHQDVAERGAHLPQHDPDAAGVPLPARQHVAAAPAFIGVRLQSAGDDRTRQEDPRQDQQGGMSNTIH